MDQELRETLAGMSSQLADVATDARQSVAFSRETTSAVNRLTTRVESLETAVFGGKPPTIPPTVPMAARITEGEGTVAELTGIVLNVKAELAEHRKSSEEDRTKAAAVLAEHTAVLAEQTQILTSIKGAVTGVISHPMAKWVARAAALAAIAWFTQAQARLEAKAEKIEHDVAKVAVDAGGAK